MRRKIAALRDVAGEVRNGSRITLGGFAITRCVVAAAHELVRARKRDLEVVQVVGGLDTDLLAGGGCLRKLVYSSGSLDRFGPLPNVNRAILAGELECEEYSSLSLTLRLHAAALGLPYVPARSLLGTGLLENLLETSDGVRLEQDPFTGAPVVALAPVAPDVAFVHVDVADEAGNAVIGGPTWSNREAAMAARFTVVVAEEVVPAGSLDPDSVTIPGPFVDAVCHVPRGAWPTAARGLYDYDRDHLERYMAAGQAGGEAYARYLDEYVYGTGSHERFLELSGVPA